MTGWDVALIGSVLLAFSMVSRRLAGSPITSAMVFAGVGLLIGNEGLGLLDIGLGSAELRLLAEVTLAVVLFSDAASLESGLLRREASTPLRLLAVGLPLTIALGWLVAVPMFGTLGVFEALILAVVLAPTDAALGETVVSDRRLPTKLRQGLNVESGLNDGICVPILVAAVALADIEARPQLEGEILVDLVKEVGIALVVGGAVAVVVAALWRVFDRRGWISADWDKIVPLVTAGVAYAAAAELGGSGFIASFVAGLVYGRLLGDRAQETMGFEEDLGQLLSAVTFLLFGAVMVGPALSQIDARTVIYAVLSLTLIRMVPVAVSLLGSRARGPTLAFAGWVGPRGLATSVFTLTIVEESALSGTRLISDVATVTVLLSVFAHGLSAPGLTDRYARWLAGTDDHLDVGPESVDT